MSEAPETNKLLTQVRDLLVLSLRNSDVPPEAIAPILGISTKSVRNRYPKRGSRTTQTEESESPSLSMPSADANKPT